MTQIIEGRAIRCPKCGQYYLENTIHHCPADGPANWEDDTPFWVD